MCCSAAVSLYSHKGGHGLWHDKVGGWINLSLAGHALPNLNILPTFQVTVLRVLSLYPVLKFTLFMFEEQIFLPKWYFSIPSSILIPV